MITFIVALVLVLWLAMVSGWLVFGASGGSDWENQGHCSLI